MRCLWIIWTIWLAVTSPVVALAFTPNTTFEDIRGGFVYVITWEDANGPVDVMMDLFNPNVKSSKSSLITSLSALTHATGIVGSQFLWTPSKSYTPFSMLVGIRDATPQTYTFSSVVYVSQSGFVRSLVQMTSATSVSPEAAVNSVSTTSLPASTLVSVITSLIPQTILPTTSSAAPSSSSQTETQSIPPAGSEPTISATSSITQGPVISSPASNASESEIQTQKHSLPSKTRIGIAIGSVIALNSILGVASIYLYRRRRRANLIKGKSLAYEKPELDSTAVQSKFREVVELPTVEKDAVELEAKRTIHEVE